MESSTWKLSLVVVLLLGFSLEWTVAQNCGSQAGGALCNPGFCCSQFGFCGQGEAWCGPGCQSGACTGSSPPPPPGPSSCGSGVGGIVSSSLFDQIFPNRNSFYTYSAFITAANSFSGFGTTGDCDTRLREIAAFFAQISHETSSLFFIEEINKDVYCEPSAQFPCAEGKRYFGRGPIQLTWNYNYKQFGDYIGVDLVSNPDLVASDAVISFRSAIWFWVTPQGPKPACSAVMTGGWTPSASDVAAGRTPTFGMTTNIINGGLECGPNPPNTSGDGSRQNFFNSISGTMGVSTGGGTSCATMTPY